MYFKFEFLLTLVSKLADLKVYKFMYKKERLGQLLQWF